MPQTGVTASFFAKSLVLALPKDGQRRFVVRRLKPNTYRQRLRKETGLRDSLTCEAIRRALSEPNGLRFCSKCSKLGRVPIRTVHLTYNVSLVPRHITVLTRGSAYQRSSDPVQLREATASTVPRGLMRVLVLVRVSCNFWAWLVSRDGHKSSAIVVWLARPSLDKHSS